MKNARPAKKLITTAIIGALSFGLPATQVFATTQVMQWSEQESFQKAGSLETLYSSLNTNHVYLSSNLGAAIALVKLGPQQVKDLTGSGNSFQMPWNTPVVFAVYDPGTTSGTIWVTRLVHQPNGTGIIELAQFTPQMGSMFAPDFENTNPFWQFIPNQNGNGAPPQPGAFVSLTQSAFYTAVGLVMQHVQSEIGWIAADNNQSHMSTSSSSSLFTASVTHKETVNTSPTWTAVVPQGGSVGGDYGYLLPIPGSASSSEQGAIDMVSDDTDAHTIGTVTSAVAQFGNDYLGQLEVNGGYAYVPAGQGANLPTAAFQSFFHSTTQTGFTGFFFDIILGVITAVTAGAAAPMMGLDAIGTAAIGFVGGFLMGMTYDIAAQGTPGFTTLQYHLLGGNCGKHNASCFGVPPVVLPAAYNSAQNYDGYQEGYINVDTNPTQSTGQWDYQPAAAQETEGNPTQDQAGFGQGYNEFRNNRSEAIHGEDLQTMSQQAEKTASGNPFFGGGATGTITGTP